MLVNAVFSLLKTEMNQRNFKVKVKILKLVEWDASNPWSLYKHKNRLPLGCLLRGESILQRNKQRRSEISNAGPYF